MATQKTNPNQVANKLKQMLSQLDDRSDTQGSNGELAKEITYNDYNKADDIPFTIPARQNGRVQTRLQNIQTCCLENLANGIVEIEHVVPKKSKNTKRKLTLGTKVTILATQSSYPS